MNSKGISTAAKRWLSLGICAALVLPLTSAGGIRAAAEGSKGSEGQRVLRIGSLWSGEDDNYFRQQFTDLYELQHPEVKLEFVPAIDTEKLRFSIPDSVAGPDNLDSMRAIMGGAKPVDVVIVDNTLLKRLADHNLVDPLQPLIDRDHYDLSNIAPTVLDGIRELGKGQLYALTPTFSSSALFYNKKIFDAAGVAYPENGMTWEKLFSVAAKVTKVSKQDKGRIYGLALNRYANDPFWDMLNYLSPLQLAMYDHNGGQMTVNTPYWSKVWTDFNLLIKKQIIPGLQEISNPESSPVGGDLFLTSKAAMTVGEYGYINELTAANRNASLIKNFQPVEWGIVSVPTFAEKPGVAMGTTLYSLMAVNTLAQNKEDAWDLIQFVNSNEVAKIKAHNHYELTSRKDYNVPPEKGLDLTPFCIQKPLPASDPAMDSLQARIPGITQINDVGRILFTEVYQGKRTVTSALQAWEKQGNLMLKALQKEPEKYFDVENGWPGKSPTTK
ncbi:ABC transporter substrate-binding protein [Paenibacillus sp. sgz5001063]|uniref:ABC transporter substrate-binding protein n=1 Tax=Paenibacillus sp. sgz5001063 TaxID=3242474 RepID=UPI0036D33B07